MGVCARHAKLRPDPYLFRCAPQVHIVSGGSTNAGTVTASNRLAPPPAAQCKKTLCGAHLFCRTHLAQCEHQHRRQRGCDLRAAMVACNCLLMFAAWRFLRLHALQNDECDAQCRTHQSQRDANHDRALIMSVRTLDLVVPGRANQCFIVGAPICSAYATQHAQMRRGFSWLVGDGPTANANNERTHSTA